MEKKLCLSFLLCHKPAYTVEPKCVFNHLLTLSPWGFRATTHRNYTCQTPRAYTCLFPRQLQKTIVHQGHYFFFFFFREITFCVQDMSECRISDRTYTLWCPWTNLFPKIPFHLACILYFPPRYWKEVSIHFAHIETGPPWWDLHGNSPVWNLQGGHLIRFAHFW